MSITIPKDRTKPGILYVFGVEGVGLVKIGYTRRQDKRGLQHRAGDRPVYVPADLHAKLCVSGEFLHVEEFTAEETRAGGDSLSPGAGSVPMQAGPWPQE